MIAQLASADLLGIIQGTRLAAIAETALPELRGIVEWEDRECRRISEDLQLRITEKQALIKARRGQGLFRQNVVHLERICRVTHADRPEHLIASHIKPWRESDNHERLFEGNGLLLTPTIDHLFDRGFISFENTGELLISPVHGEFVIERRRSANQAHLPPSPLPRKLLAHEKRDGIAGASTGQTGRSPGNRRNPSSSR